MHPAIAAGPVAATARRRQLHMYVSMPTCCRHVQYVNASPYACTAVYACMIVRRWASMHACMQACMHLYLEVCTCLGAYACRHVGRCSFGGMKACRDVHVWILHENRDGMTAYGT